MNMSVMNENLFRVAVKWAVVSGRCSPSRKVMTECKRSSRHCAVVMKKNGPHGAVCLAPLSFCDEAVLSSLPDVADSHKLKHCPISSLVKAARR